jgi:hypothetical protein
MHPLLHYHTHRRVLLSTLTLLPSGLLLTAQAGGRRIRFVLVLFMLLCCSAQQSYGAKNLECPEIGSGAIPELFGAALSTIENRVDPANEINEAINTLQIASPNISWSEVQNVLIAAYCHVVARKPGLAAARNGPACASSTVSLSARSRQT